MSKLKRLILLAPLALLVTGNAHAGEIADITARINANEAQTSYIFNTLLFLIGGFLVMWMAAGFAMLEAGLVRSKNVSMQCLKNISHYAVAGIMFWLIGYKLMYTIPQGGILGTLHFMDFSLTPGVSPYADWLFQMMFCAATASIVSGAVAERIKFWPFLIFTSILCGIIYPITGSWEWGKGWLDVLGFSDFAGSTLVHSVGGWAALAGIIILGPRAGKYNGNRVHPMPGSSMPLATLGMFILWFGWFGFNGASQLAMGTISDVDSIAKIFVNTNMAGCAGMMAAIIYMSVRYKKIDVTMAINGALAGLVAITAEPLAPNVPVSMLVGAIGSILAMLTVPLLDKFKIDDVIGAVPVHLVAGVFGTLAVAFTNPDVSFKAQIIGVLAVGIFAVTTSAIIWLALKYTIGIRVSAEDESIGLDHAEVGIAAYPEFVS
ncbi:MAG: ammonium transporter [Robiginitomaculum sp.]